MSSVDAALRILAEMHAATLMKIAMTLLLLSQPVWLSALRKSGSGICIGVAMIDRLKSGGSPRILSQRASWKSKLRASLVQIIVVPRR
jgi:hypothetical protein